MFSAMQIKHLISLSSLLLSVDKIAFETEKENEMKENHKAQALDFLPQKINLRTPSWECSYQVTRPCCWILTARVLLCGPALCCPLVLRLGDGREDLQVLFWGISEGTDHMKFASVIFSSKWSLLADTVSMAFSYPILPDSFIIKHPPCETFAFPFRFPFSAIYKGP